jgi:hypothetical protein
MIHGRPYAGGGKVPDDRWHDLWLHNQGPAAPMGPQQLRPGVKSLPEINISHWNVTFRNGGDGVGLNGPALWQDRYYEAVPADSKTGQDAINFFDSDNSYELSMVFAKLAEPLRPGQSAYIWVEHDIPKQMQSNLWIVCEDYDPETLTWGNMPSSPITNPDDPGNTWKMTNAGSIMSSYTIGTDYPTGFGGIDVDLSFAEEGAGDSFRIGTIKFTGAGSPSELRDNTVYAFAFSCSSFAYLGNGTRSIDNFDCRVWPIPPTPA